MNTERAFKIGPISAASTLFLAPMDGFTDHPFRMIAKKLGAGVIISEFINGLDVASRHPSLKKLTYFREEERPFGYQIFDESPQRILAAAQFLAERNPDFIDVNFGCSAKKVANRGAGAGLLRTPQKIGEIISLLVKHIPLPITAKIRLGWDEDSLNYLEVSRIIEEEGAAWIAVHGRSKQQGYTGAANWDAIQAVKSARKIPVIANGDVNTTGDIERIRMATGCDGVMIARGALINPWIFQNRDIEQVSFEERYAGFLEHFHAIQEFYGEESGMLLFRKHLRSYVQIDRLSRKDRIALFTQKDAHQFIQQVEQFMLQPLALQPA